MRQITSRYNLPPAAGSVAGRAAGEPKLTAHGRYAASSAGAATPRITLPGRGQCGTNCRIIPPRYDASPARIFAPLSRASVRPPNQPFASYHYDPSAAMGGPKKTMPGGIRQKHYDATSAVGTIRNKFVILLLVELGISIHCAMENSYRKAAPSLISSGGMVFSSWRELFQQELSGQSFGDD